MYEKYSFLGEEETSVKTFPEAMEVCKNRERVVLTAKYKDLNITDTGQIVIGKAEHQITSWGFEKLCAILGIPKPFARKIPEDLLKENIARLLKEKNGDDEINFFNSKKGLLGVAKKQNDPFENIDFLTQMSTLHSGTAEIHDIIVSDRGVTLNFFSPSIPNLEPVKGDITRVGFNTHNSDTGGAPSTSHLFLYRLACENGAIMKEIWGTAKRTYNKKITKETSLLNFQKQTEQISTNAALLSSCFTKMIDMEVTDEFFRKIWTTVKRVVGSEAVVDEALEISKETRKEMFAGISKRKNNNRRKLISDVPAEVAVPIGRTYYELYNQTTAMEKGFRLDERINLRKAGGDILYSVLKTEVALVDEE